MIKEITSRDNKLVKHVIKLGQRAYREKNRQYIVEGKRIAEEALAYALESVSAVIVSEGFGVGMGQGMVQEFGAPSDSGKSVKVYRVSDKLFKEMCQTDTPQGILLVMDMPPNRKINFSEARRVMVLDGVKEPGNMGTIIRTSEAAGCDGIVLLKGCTDIYGPKTVRSTMGSIFRQRFMVMDGADALNILKENGFTVVVASLDGENMYNVSIGDKCALIVGSEADGVSEEISSLADKRVRIPMAGKVESLNAAVSAAVATYWFWGRFS